MRLRHLSYPVIYASRWSFRVWKSVLGPRGFDLHLAGRGFSLWIEQR